MIDKCWKALHDIYSIVDMFACDEMTVKSTGSWRQQWRMHENVPLYQLTRYITSSNNRQ